MKLEEACTFLSDIINIPAVILDTSEQIEQFCTANHFHSVQKNLTHSGIRHLLERLSEENMIVYVDALRIHMTFLLVQKRPVVVGPYCTEELSEPSVELLKRRYSIRNLPAKDFLSYRSNYHSISDEEIIRYCHALRNHISPDHPATVINRFQDELPRRPEEWQYTRQNYQTLVTERYRVESEMMTSILTGDAATAIRKYRYLHNNVRFMRSIGSSLNAGTASAAIVRTTVRIPMMNAGLPPILIDQITGESAHNIARCETRQEIANENERLIRTACEAIRRFRTGRYSMPVYSAIYDIERHYTAEFTVEEMAERLGLSTSYFIRLFKKETLMTPNEYLIKYRLKCAADLLHHSNFTVSQISSEVGFFDPNYFTKQFRKVYGMTPIQYRGTTGEKQNDAFSIKKRNS